jgi:putative transport protein
VAGFLAAGPIMIAGGILVTLIPVLVGYGFGTRVLKMNPALLLGAITGAMTSTPSLQVISETARSPIPSLGYAGTYAFANVLLTFAGAFIMLI